ncbi:NADP-dependent oxidoreductase domain-containing protein [Phascolomyces articulosus]|uniref:NADP-dependent oxidoreductase domain-containing protein n=1 Tax=Phascolomyces articulosus TaxID=60185 RepID=A0AAD5KZB1_9FUNG|nr:NADP-dependent oxidoreductase domain-containing protein [Phascolomyces articulosus]
MTIFARAVELGCNFWDTTDMYYGAGENKRLLGRSFAKNKETAKKPIKETITAMADLVKEGNVRFIGISECSSETLRRAYKVHPIAAVEVGFEPWTLDIQKNG